MTRTHTMLAALCASVAVTVAAQDAAPRYTIADLGTLGGDRSSATGINDHGQVVGAAQTAEGHHRAFLWSDGALVDLGTFGGAESFAYRISDASLIVGRAQAVDGRFRAFVTTAGGAMADLTTLDGRVGGEYGAAFGVNAAGEVAGYFTTPGPHMMAHNRVFRYRDFRVTDLGTFGGDDGIVTAVNDQGALAGYFSAEPHADYAHHRGFVHSRGRLVAIPPLGGRTTSPRDINRHGVVIGDAQNAAGEPRAFLFRDGVTTDLGALDGGRQSAAFGMNDAGDVVGMAEGRDGALRAVLFRGGVAVDLNDRIDPASGWRLTEARDINARGQIVGTGWLHGRQRAFLLTPVR